MVNPEVKIKEPGFSDLAFELQRKVYESGQKLGQLSLDAEPREYIDTLDSWETNSLKLRQLERRNNLGLL
jgi:hypothetical protein